jgi:transcriptional regulator NrdR family protein
VYHAHETGPECPFCSCADTRVLTAPGEEGWFGRLGVGFCQHCQNRFSFKSEEEEAREEAELDEADPAVIVVPAGGPVRYQPVRCPRCRSRHCPANTTRPSKAAPVIVRYHRCSTCGHRFKSVEQTDPPAPGEES